MATRNSNEHFAVNPIRLDMKRSRFRRPHSHTTTGNTGRIIPMAAYEVLPGDTVQMKSACSIRMQTPIYPIMDDIYADTYWFFVPRRLVWDNWKKFMGESETSEFVPVTDYEIPQLTAPAGGWQKGTIADYLGYPTKIENISVDACYTRAYALIWNNWFKDQNTMNSAYIHFDDATQQGTNGDTLTDMELGGMCAKACRNSDYFSRALTAPQRGPAVSLPIGDMAPVITGDTHDVNSNALHLVTTSGGAISQTSTLGIGSSSNLATTSQSAGTIYQAAQPDNLWADLQQGSMVNINQLRQAFAVQRWYEQSGRAGNRYREVLKGFFGVTSPDARMQIPEYLGGQHWRINMQQVVQTSSTDTTSPQGNTAAYSHTTGGGRDFTKSFTEHGILMCMLVIRYDHKYQQGLARQFSRKTRFDFYWPQFSSLGDMPIYNKEIFAQGTKQDDEVFGYQEPWAKYRYEQSRVSGEMRSNYEQSLDSWHLADFYKDLPTFTKEWMEQGSEALNRVIAVSDKLADQWLIDMAFSGTWDRIMPVYGVPGLIDHH